MTGQAGGVALQSDTTIHRGRITNRAASWCSGPRWKPSNVATSTAASGQLRDYIGTRRGRNIGVVAAAWELIDLIFFYGLRDGHICDSTRTAA
jgi:hypothetical protein